LMGGTPKAAGARNEEVEGEEAPKKRKAKA
jgi:hypothetical protein